MGGREDKLKGEVLELPCLIWAYFAFGLGIYYLDFIIKYKLADSVGLKSVSFLWYVGVTCFWPIIRIAEYHENKEMLEKALEKGKYYNEYHR